MTKRELTSVLAADIGRAARDYGNPLIQAFAAELLGESYPLSTALTQVTLKLYSDEQLGRKFAAWMDGPVTV